MLIWMLKFKSIEFGAVYRINLFYFVKLSSKTWKIISNSFIEAHKFLVYVINDGLSWL